MEIRCAIMVSAYSSTSLRRMVGEVRNRLMMGWSPGLTLRKDGGVGMPGGSSVMASAMAVSTSTVAPSISRLRSNWRVILLDPWLLLETMESRPAIEVNWRSRGVATAEAMVSGLAPGRLADTVMVG